LIILGIDPGLATVGFGVVDSGPQRMKPVNFGIISTPAGMPLPRRLAMIYQDVQQLIGIYRPDAIALEELFFYRNVTTAIDVAQARGVALIAAANAVSDGQIFEYTPMQVKLAVCGYGHADKGQVQRMVSQILGLSCIPKPDDAADALAVAICHGQSAVLGRQFMIQ
jgi:crossover junction endodeoxyribonuclease RuvC